MKKVLFAVLFCLVASNVFAETKPFQASVTPEIAIHSKDTRIEGFSLSIWGENPQSGGAVGLVNGSSGDSNGLSFGLLNYAENYKGFECCIVNFAKGDFTGFQYGFINYSKNFKGFQLGAINVADTAHGLQIGFINIIKKNEWFKKFPNELAKGMVLINWSF
jgi:hypothetical protein